MKRIVLFLLVLLVTLTVAKTTIAADSWEAKKDSGAWEEQGYLYAVGQATYEREMNQEQETVAFDAAKKMAAEKIKKAKTQKTLKTFQLVDYEYYDKYLLVLISIPVPTATAESEKISYPACGVASANWKNKQNGEIFNCDLAGKLYTYAITMASYTSDKDIEKAKQSAIDDGKKVLAGHIEKPIADMSEKYGFYAEIFDDPTAKTLKVLSRCANPSPPPKGAATVDVSISNSDSTYSTSTSSYSYTTNAEKEEARGVTNESQIITACDELKITSYEKIPDNWNLLYDKNIKAFRVVNTLYTIGRSYKKKSAKDWSTALTGAKVDAQTQLIKITGTVITNIVCNENDRDCVSKIKTSGIAKGLENEKEFRDENSKEEKKPCYVLMAVPFSEIVNKF